VLARALARNGARLATPSPHPLALRQSIVVATVPPIEAKVNVVLVGRLPEVLTGTVVPGRGLGAPLMGELDADRLAALFGVPAAVPGTLNVRLERPIVHRAGWRYVPADAIAPDWQARTGQAGYFVVAVLIADRYRGIAFQGDEPDYPPEQVELVSDTRLRAGLGLADGDPISFAVVAEPGGNALSS